MGRVTAPFGVQGWLRIHALTAEVGNLRAYPVWWLRRGAECRAMRVTAAKVHGSGLVAQLDGIADRESAAGLKGWDVAVPRAQLPGAAADEYYWADLVGLRVVNLEQHEFGRVARIMRTGANDVLVVGAQDGTETLIPFIAGAIREVDLATGMIRVDWGLDY